MADATARVAWQEGMRFRAVPASGITFILDEKRQEDGSGGQGPNPAEILPISLAGCTGMDVIGILKKMQQKVSGLEVEIAYSRADEHPRRFTAMKLTYHLDGEDLDAERIERAITLSVGKYCSVSATIDPAIPMQHFYTVNGSDPVRVEVPLPD